ncbi:MAG: hypothetical protein V7644_322 [Actinomycetota bacterium]
MSALLALVLATSGLHGVVTRGPTQPVCQVGVPCSKPAVGAVLVFSRNGTVAARVRTGTGGRYAVRLQPGDYTVRTAPTPKIGSGLRPRRVHVLAGVLGRANFLIDTGIR